MGTVTILPMTTKNPITLIGQCAGVCWNADTGDPEKNYRRGIDCITSGHGRTLEFPDVYMQIDGYSARVIREWYTHIGCLPTRLQASTRYINYEDFGAVVPHTIRDNREACLVYASTVDTIRRSLHKLAELGIPREDASYLLPIGMKTRMIDKRNLRNLIDMSRNRMCERALWEFRELFKDICQALMVYSDEWFTVVTTLFKPKCDALGFCPEKHGCGRYPKAGESHE